MVADEDDHTTSECNVLSQSDDTNEKEIATEVGNRSFMPLPLQKDREDTVIRSAINRLDPLVWPAIDEEPLTEF